MLDLPGQLQNPDYGGFVLAELLPIMQHTRLTNIDARHDRGPAA